MVSHPGRDLRRTAGSEFRREDDEAAEVGAVRRSLDTLAQFDGGRAAGELGLGLVAALREHHGEHGLLGVAELVVRMRFL